jgi:hypothetical protein
MGDEQEEIINFYKKRIEPFMAIFVLTFLIVGCVLLYQDNQFKKEISKNCGWGEEDYKCYCEKKYISSIEAEARGQIFIDEDFNNDTMVIGNN